METEDLEEIKEEFNNNCEKMAQEILELRVEVEELEYNLDEAERELDTVKGLMKGNN